MKSNRENRLKKIEILANKNFEQAKIAKIPNSWIRYEDNSYRWKEVVDAFEIKYGVKVRRVYIIPSFDMEENYSDNPKDGDHFFPDENSLLKEKKLATIYCFILKNK